MDQSYEIVWNAIVIAAFVGLGLNINAFQIKSDNAVFHSLKGRIRYLKSNFINVCTFFVIPFCVSSASGFVMAGKDQNVVKALFGTDNYLLVMVVGFATFIILPMAIIFYKYGWED